MSRPALAQLQMMNRNGLFRNNLNNNEARYPLIYLRDRIFHNAFIKFTVIYSRICSVRERKIIEFFLLALSFFSFVLLTYVHVAFVKTPTDCLAHIQKKWPRDGILRVEIIQEKLNEQYSLEKSYLKEKKIRELEYEDPTYFFLSGYFDDDGYQPILNEPNVIKSSNSNAISALHANSNNASFNVTIDKKMTPEYEDKAPLPTLTWSDDEYIMEFSLEYGFLKLSPSVRKQYNVTVQLVTLDPSVDKCFGGKINNFLLYNFLGYDEVLLASLKLLAATEEYKGYVRNVVTEVEYIFVNGLMDRKSYITAGFVMMVFTVSISILLRYSHHQIFVFIIELVHVFEYHASINFPAGPLLTVILALVGMEAIMSEFFNDTAIAFYVILIVWMADQFDTTCCKSSYTKKHWLRFFYLYHFFFYAYSYRFGHNRFLALLTSWFFTMHSMVYFFHRYDLPLLIARHNQQQNNNPPDDNPPTPPANDQPPNDDQENEEAQEDSFAESDAQDRRTPSTSGNEANESDINGEINTDSASPINNLSSESEIGIETSLLDVNNKNPCNAKTLDGFVSSHCLKTKLCKTKVIRTSVEVIFFLNMLICLFLLYATRFLLKSTNRMIFNILCF